MKKAKVAFFVFIHRFQREKLEIRDQDIQIFDKQIIKAKFNL
jgi:hypothetical protein